MAAALVISRNYCDLVHEWVNQYAAASLICLEQVFTSCGCPFASLLFSNLRLLWNPPFLFILFVSLVALLCPGESDRFIEASKKVSVMGDHFVLLVDRLLTESTLEAAIESLNQRSKTAITTMSIVDKEADFSPKKKFVGDGMFSGKLVECRICQDEDEDSNLEIPCSCSGSLQFAHRKCVQKWCNEKGDTTCEICLQQFKPGYTAPPKLFLYGTTPMSFRGNWEISRRDINSRQYITMTPTDRAIVRPNYYDHAASHARSTMYCRIVAATFMVILILRHSLPLIKSGAYQYSIPLSTLLLLRIAGIVLPLYIILRAVTTFYQRRRRLQEMRELSSISVPEMENGQLHSLQLMQPQSHLTRIY